jgi:hypothetical protein
MTVAPDDSDFEPWPGEDPIHAAIGVLLVAIMEGTREDSPERRRAMSEALEAHRRIQDAMRDRHTLN